MNLEELRKEIDEIDEALADLFVRRMSLSAQIAEYKIANGRSIEDVSREKEVTKKFEKLIGEMFAPYAGYFCSGLFDASKAFQKDYMKREQL